MFSFIFLALAAIAIGCLILLGYRWEEAQDYMKGCNKEQLDAYVEIHKAQLRENGKWVNDENYEPDFTPLAIALILVALCALAGFPTATIFFMLCFGACAYQLTETIKSLMIVQHAAGDTAYATV